VGGGKEVHANRRHRSIDDLDHAELAILAREHLLAGHLIDRAGMPIVVSHGLATMREVAIDEWMGASPIYTKRMQRLLGFEGNTVEVALKGMQLDIGAPPEFMDFRFTVHDDHHGEFHLDHCGALMDVEPLGDEFVVSMCHNIEDPTFDATGWATNSRLRMRPVHRPPRVPSDRHPHCAWTVEIVPDAPETAAPEQALRIGRTNAAQLPIATRRGAIDDGDDAYPGPLDPDLALERFASATLRAVIDEVCLQGHLLVLAFGVAVGERLGDEAVESALQRQFTGVAGVASERLARAFRLQDDVTDIATVFDLHPAFHPRGYVDWRVTEAGDAVLLELSSCPAIEEPEYASWITALAQGRDCALSAIAAGVDPHWSVRPDGPLRWRVERGEDENRELDEVMITKFSTGARFEFAR
jgi:hypothetical protein